MNLFKKLCPKCKYYLCICNLKNIYYKYNEYIYIKKNQKEMIKDLF